MKKGNYLTKAVAIASAAYKIFSSSPAYAEANKMEINPIDTRSNSKLELSLSDKDLQDMKGEDLNKKFITGAKDILGLTIGAAAMLATHEGGHYLMAKGLGEDIEFEGKRWHFKNENVSNSKRKATILAGFGLPMAISEGLLQSDNIDKDNPIVMGYISASLLHNVAYVVKDALGKKNGGNDYREMEKARLSRKITYPLTIIPAAIQAYRLWDNPDVKNKINFWVNTGKGVSAGITGKFSSKDIEDYLD